jgi:hypothetical protein
MLSSSRAHVPRHAAVPVCGGGTASNGRRQRLRHGPYAIRGAPRALSGEDAGPRGASAASCRKTGEICGARTAPRGRFVRPRGRREQLPPTSFGAASSTHRDCGPEQRSRDRSMPGRQTRRFSDCGPNGRTATVAGGRSRLLYPTSSSPTRPTPSRWVSVAGSPRRPPSRRRSAASRPWSAEARILPAGRSRCPLPGTGTCLCRRE